MHSWWKTQDFNKIESGPNYTTAVHAFVKATLRLGLRAPFVARNNLKAVSFWGHVQYITSSSVLMPIVNFKISTEVINIINFITCGCVRSLSSDGVNSLRKIRRSVQKVPSSFCFTRQHMATVPTFYLMANMNFSKTQVTAGKVSLYSFCCKTSVTL